MYAHKPSMVWEVSLLEFILNRMVELVKNMKSFRHDFRESHMKKVVSDVFGFTTNIFLRMGFTGISVTIIQLCNHTRKWRWTEICRLKEECKMKWSNESTCFLVDDEEQLRQHLLG
jgi:hypothetical protein